MSNTIEIENKSSYTIMEDEVITCIEEGKNILVHAPAGNGKCLALNTPVIRHDGRVVMVQDIIRGDLLMGDDSTPRTVLTTTSGIDTMYRITTELGDSYTVNNYHILTFSITPSLKRHTTIDDCKVVTWGNIHGKLRYSEFKSDQDAQDFMSMCPQECNIPIYNCLDMTREWHDHYKGKYGSLQGNYNYDIGDCSYIYGVWLVCGEGNPTVSDSVYKNVPTSVLDRLKGEYRVTPVFPRGSLLIRDNISETHKLPDKHIHPDYLSSDVDQRFKLLAGIVGVAGTLQACHGYQIVLKNKNTAKDVYYLAKSLRLQTIMTSVDGHSIIIINDMNRLDYMKLGVDPPYENTPTPYNGTSKIFIECVGDSQYYGFELDGNHKFLLGNFLVTHNSYLVKNINECLKDKRNISLTSTTGVSAFFIGNGCKTIHSFAGLQVGDKDVDYYIRRIRRNTRQFKEINDSMLLVIDEISMMGAELIEKLDIVLKVIRRNTDPFGGLQVIFSGDFLQLPPVKDDFCFNSPVWDKLKLTSFKLTEPQRHKNDKSYYRMLMRIREGKPNKRDINRLYARNGVYFDMSEEERDNLGAVVLFPTNFNVKNYNLANLEELKTPEFMYKACVVGKKNYVFNNMIEDTLSFKVGAQVMLTVNISVETGLVNGATGKVLLCEGKQVTVAFVNGMTVPVGVHEFIMDEEKGIKVLQIPLRLAWAVSIHKSQSCTLDRVVIDLGNCFEDGQAYVALSRAKSLDGVFLTDFDPASIKVNADVVDFVKSL
jgi:ATP-dependent DNA helicase PIF1